MLITSADVHFSAQSQVNSKKSRGPSGSPGYAPEHLERDPGHFEKDSRHLPSEKSLVTPLLVIKPQTSRTKSEDFYDYRPNRRKK